MSPIRQFACCLVAMATSACSPAPAPAPAPSGGNSAAIAGHGVAPDPLARLAAAQQPRPQAETRQVPGSVGTAPDEIGGWVRHELPPSARWNEFTHALAVGETLCFLHGRTLHRREPDGSWREDRDLLPTPVDHHSACTVDRDGKLLVVPGHAAPGLRVTLDPLGIETIPALALQTYRGAVTAVDQQNRPHVILGGRRPDFGRVEAGAWQPLPDVDTVNPVGAYSAGLFCIEGGDLVAFGDHHVNRFRVEAGEWDVKNRLFVQLGFRPALDRGGMVAQDPATGDVLMTLGKSSRSFGRMTMQQRFYQCRPRLPFRLEDPDRGLCITTGQDGGTAWLLSRQQGALFSLPMAEVVHIGVADRVAASGSRFETWNSRASGSHGDLSRERDSACNLVYAPPHIYIQRKNIVRQVELVSWLHSKSGVGHRYGQYFASAGAAFCFDGGERIYLYNGYSQDFWCLYLRERLDGSRSDAHVGVEEMKVERVASIPEFHGIAPRDGRPTNTPMVAHDGAIWALFDPTTRALWRFDPDTAEWTSPTVLPAGVSYSDDEGADLFSDGGRLLLLSGDTLVAFSPDTGWSAPVDVGFRYLRDGGMAVYDQPAGLIYVSIGGRSEDFGVVRVADGRARLLRGFFPDCVSVPGRRMFLDRSDGATWLYLFRGHDSAEYWRTRVSGDMALRVD